MTKRPSNLKISGIEMREKEWKIMMVKLKTLQVLNSIMQILQNTTVKHHILD